MVSSQAFCFNVLNFIQRIPESCAAEWLSASEENPLRCWRSFKRIVACRRDVSHGEVHESWGKIDGRKQR